ncbi:MAG: 3-oxoacyl-[acyl-carrier-protein] synthase III C-terminal domain-containing protein [Balneolaceae bacterium]|nr:3-oxoacyl-[acyl-carrier-protein] synthase III C-terminal domain-containing protein [Balneolaceae bacterium]
MGCFAAFPALKMARSFCESREDAVVMVICLELCTLHFQKSTVADSLISASVFADGAAGAIINNKPGSQKASLKLENFATSVIEQSEEDMAWTIGDTGFDMVLSTYVPKIIESNLRSSLSPLLESYGVEPKQIRHWAIHPGGRAILDKAEQNLGIAPDQLASSRAILSDYGNMSSATILFVLKHLLDQPMQHETERVLGMAFGPGLTVESGLFLKKRG